MRIRRSITLAVALVAALAASAGNATSTVSLAPPVSDFAGATTSFELWMDFTGVTIQGGGVSMDLTGPLALAATPFVPSAYMTTLIGGGFAGYGTANANPGYDFLVYFGAFEGITGLQKLGDFVVSRSGAGLASIVMSESTAFSFTSLDNNSVPVTVTGVAAVPAPASAWLLATGVGAIGAWRRRKSSRKAVAQAC